VLVRELKLLKRQEKDKVNKLLGIEPDEVVDGIHFEKEPKDVKKAEHYYTKNPKSKLIKKLVYYDYDSKHRYKFYNVSGVFSFKPKVDRATRVLIENCKVNPGDKVLDLGCGYGVIGIVLKRLNPDIELFMSDVNQRAVSITKENCKLNNVEAIIKNGDLFEPWNSQKFDSILSNPPFAAGMKVITSLIEESYNHLNNFGSLQLVAYHNKGGKRLENMMKDKFGNVSELVKSGGIRVYMSIKEE
jgi:16S rRNA (guanine1207-N2)-methyltransferase